MFKQIVCALGLVVLPAAAGAVDYGFGPDVVVNDPPIGGFFRSTTAAGTRAVACLNDTVYVVWEDRRTPVSGVYLSQVRIGGDRMRVSPPGVLFQELGAACHLDPQ